MLMLQRLRLYLSVVPLVLISLPVICSGQAFERTRDRVARKDRNFVYSDERKGKFTYAYLDGHETQRVSATIPRPVSMDSMTVVDAPEHKANFSKGNDRFRKHVFDRLRTGLRTLNDGKYTLNLRDILVDTNGRVVFFGYEGVRPATTGKTMDVDDQIVIYNRLCSVMDKASFTPGMTDGRRVVSYYDDSQIWETPFTVTGRKVKVGR